MSDFRFENPGAFMLLWMIPVIYGLWRYFNKQALQRIQKGIDAKLIPVLADSVSETKRRWKLRLQLIVVTLMILAWARPQTSEGRVQVKNEGIEILLMVDVSNSMLSEDTRPSRLEVAKSELTRFVEMSAGNRMALVAFAGSAVLLSPMTTDMNALKMYIESLDPDAVSTQGTDFSKALVEAFDAFERGGLGENSDAQVTRAILVISDGEDQEPGLKGAVEKLTKENIHIFTMGVGTEEGGAIPVRDDQGVLRGYKRDKDGQVIMSKTSGTVLKDLAKAGKGSFHHASFQGDAIAAIRSDIEQLKKSQFESGEIRSFDEKFQFLLFLALALGLLEIWLGDRKAVGRIWLGRFEVARD